MSYTKKIWVNRLSEYPTRRKLVSTGTQDEYDIVRSEGAVSQEGDPFNSETMNDLEERISTGFSYGSIDLPAITIPADAVWTQLTTANEMDPDMEFPWYTDVQIAGLTENDKVEVMADTPTGKLKLADFNQTYDGEIKIYAKQSYTGTVLKFPEVTKRKVNI